MDVTTNAPVAAARHVGFATEIGRAALGYAFCVLNAPEVVAFTEVHNLRSPAVMERLGMSYQKEISLPGLIDGRDGIQPAARFALYTLQAP